MKVKKGGTKTFDCPGSEGEPSGKGGVSILEVSRTPTKDCWSVLGIGVAVNVRISMCFFEDI